MADLGRWTGGSVSILPTTTWAAPNGMFPTEDRNDSSVYSFTSSTSTLTLPSSSLADGYLLIGSFDLHDTSNGRCNPQGRFIQASGTGTFVSNASSGFNRDIYEDRSYVKCWAFVDNPSTSSTYQFQWRRDSDSPTGNTERSTLEVIPFYYADIGLYSSTSTTCTGGTTPTLVTGFTGTDGTNITISSNQITVTGDNKRYLCLGGYYWQGIGNARTQRWGGFEIDGTFDDAAKGYSYARNSANADIGELFTRLIETDTADRTIEMNIYRGDGVANLQGGANVDGNTTGSNPNHVMVVMELNDSAEVFSSVTTANTSALNSSPTDLDITPTTGIEFNDSASFTRASDTAMNAEVTGDFVFGSNVSAAANNVASTARWTAYAEFTINGTPDSNSFAGDYLRNNQGSQDTFGWSANLLGFEALTSGDDIGVRVTELALTRNGGDAVSPSGWSSFWGINLDTLEDAGGTDYTITADGGTYTSTGQTTTLTKDYNLTAESGSYSSTGQDATFSKGFNLSAETDSYATTGQSAGLIKDSTISSESGSFTTTGQSVTLTKSYLLTSDSGAYTLTGQDATLSTASDTSLSAESGSFSILGTSADFQLDRVLNALPGSYSISGQSVDFLYSKVFSADAGSFTITGSDATLAKNITLTADSGAYTLTGQASTLRVDLVISAESESYTITGSDAQLLLNRILQAEATSYTTTGTDVSFTVANLFGDIEQLELTSTALETIEKTSTITISIELSSPVVTSIEKTSTATTSIELQSTVTTQINKDSLI